MFFTSFSGIDSNEFGKKANSCPHVQLVVAVPSDTDLDSCLLVVDARKRAVKFVSLVTSCECLF